MLRDLTFVTVYAVVQSLFVVPFYPQFLTGIKIYYILSPMSYYATESINIKLKSFRYKLELWLWGEATPPSFKKPKQISRSSDGHRLDDQEVQDLLLGLVLGRGKSLLRV